MNETIKEEGSSIAKYPDHYHDAPQLAYNGDPEVAQEAPEVHYPQYSQPSQQTLAAYMVSSDYRLPPVVEKAPQHGDPKSGRRLSDMRARTFWLLFGLAGLIIIGATVGGAVGGSMAAKKTSTSNSTASPTTTTSAGTTPSSRASNCTDGNLIYSKWGNSATWQFQTYCGHDITGDLHNQPLAGALVPDFNSCLDLCAGLNLYQVGNASRCVAASYVASFGAPANCWAHSSPSLKEASLVIAAVLVT